MSWLWLSSSRSSDLVVRVREGLEDEADVVGSGERREVGLEEDVYPFAGERGADVQEPDLTQSFELGREQTVARRVVARDPDPDDPYRVCRRRSRRARP